MLDYMDTCTYNWGIPLLWVLLPGTLCIQCFGIYTYSAKFWQSKFLWIAVFEDIDEKICVLCIRNYVREFGNNPCACRTCNLLWASLASLVLSNALSHLHLLKLTAVSKAMPIFKCILLESIPGGFGSIALERCTLMLLQSEWENWCSRHKNFVEMISWMVENLRN